MPSVYNHSDTDLSDLHRRVEQLLSGHSRSALSEQGTVEAAGYSYVPETQYAQTYYNHGSHVGPPPSYEQHIERQQEYSPFSRISQLSITEEEPSEELVSTATSSSSSPSPYTYTQAPGRPYFNMESLYQNLYTSDNLSSDNMFSNPPLSPISESSSGVCNNLSGVNTRSVSAAVSDESVAGDSGVFEASHKRFVALDTAATGQHYRAMNYN